MDDPAVRRALDEEHLRLLRLGYLLSGALSAIFAVFPLFYVAMGLFFVGGGTPGTRGLGRDPAMFGWLFVAFGLVFFVWLAGTAALKLAAARAIGKRRMHTFCLVAAAVTTLGIPWGTVLGVLSFLVLERPGVKTLFGPPATPSRSTPPSP